MCGIAGFVQAAPGEREGMLATVTRMADAIVHRGPDAGGAWTDAAAGVALGHRRLSIIDLSPGGSQPMMSASERHVLVFNGEIYNHEALRAELEAEGAAPVWRGRSDTETLLAAFERWGVPHALERLVGMFAFALWDRRERSLILGRDRFGEKPLYYGWAGRGDGQALIFGSELKALRGFPGFGATVRRDVLALYLQHSVAPAPYCIYEGAFKLPPGCLLILAADGVRRKTVEVRPYWRLTDVIRSGLAAPIRCEAEAVETLEATLCEAVRLQLAADVPLGAFLSGGVDSSTIIALMQAQSSQPVRTFTVGFDEMAFDESPHASAVARHLGTDHHELRVAPADVLAVIPKLPLLYDEPFADSSQIPTYLVCQAARQQVAVALSGDAGDELFGGYNRYFWGERVWGWFHWLSFPLRRGLGSAIGHFPASLWDVVGRFLPGANGVARFGDKAHRLGRRLQTVDSLDDLYRSLMKEWPLETRLALGADGLPTLLDDQSLAMGVCDAPHRMMLWDSLTYLPDDILTKVDRAAMGVSLETRAPFLDHRVAELAWRLPLEMKIRNGQGKWALRQVLYKYVPKALIERPKAGFAVPVGEWLRGPLRDWAEPLLEEKRLSAEGYLNPEPIREAWRQHLSGRYDWTPRLWTVLMFQAWLELNA